MIHIGIKAWWVCPMIVNCAMTDLPSVCITINFALVLSLFSFDPSFLICLFPASALLFYPSSPHLFDSLPLLPFLSFSPFSLFSRLLSLDILYPVRMSCGVPRPSLLECVDRTMAVPWSQLLCLVGNHEKHWAKWVLMKADSTVMRLYCAIHSL